MRELEKKSSRAFNKVVINPQLGIVIKKSTDIRKLGAEACWYDNIPESLQGLIPKKISYSYDVVFAELVMDYCTFPSLYEILMSGVEVDWTEVQVRLYQVHKMFQDQPLIYALHQKNAKKDLVNFHTSKLESRVEKLRTSDNYWAKLMDMPTIKINGKELKNLSFSILAQFIKDGEEYTTPSVVHGDYCFSNILYDLNTNCVKLIDPRGSFSHEGFYSIYGDSQYDFAKLLHSFIGYYDFIVGKKYLIDEENHQFGSYEFSIDVPEDFKSAGNLLRQQVAQKSLKEQQYIYALHCSLFWSMIPLHYDDFMRQLAFYLRAVQLYNDLLDLD